MKTKTTTIPAIPQGTVTGPRTPKPTTSTSAAIAGRTLKAVVVATVLAVLLTMVAVVPKAVAQEPGFEPGDVFVIDSAGATGLEVHAIDGLRPMDFVMHASTPLGSSDVSSFDTEVGDFDGDGVEDLFLVKYQGATSAELHVLDGASTHSTFLLQTPIALARTTSAETDFEVGDFDGDGQLDLYIIKVAGNNATEVHVLSGASGYQDFLLHTATPLPPTNLTHWDFEIGRYSGDGADDLYIVKTQGSTTTELHVLSGESGFQNWVLHARTGMAKTTTAQFDFEVADNNGDGVDDVYAVKFAGATSTELHIIDGANPVGWLLQSGTALYPTSSARWDFAIGAPVTPESSVNAPTEEPVPEPSPLDPFATDLVEVTNNEATTYAGRHECYSATMSKRVGQYWRFLGNSLNGCDRGVPWSAAFISYMMNSAGAGDRFRYSSAHRVYIHDAFAGGRGLYGSVLNTANVQPDLGDLVCSGRGRVANWSYQSFVNWYAAGGINHDSIPTHCDIVIAVSGSRITVVGGNVNQRVTKKTVSTSSYAILLPVSPG